MFARNGFFSATIFAAALAATLVSSFLVGPWFFISMSFLALLGNCAVLERLETYRVQERRIGLAESDDDFHFRVRPEPFMVPASEGVFATYEEYGVEDPRICALGGRYLITYSTYSRHGVRIGLAQTEDFESVERISLITEADYRNRHITGTK